MFNFLKPDYYYDNIFDIDLNKLKSAGIKGIICDIDNTIVPYDQKVVTEEVSNWFFKLHRKNFAVCLISNGFERRVKYFRQKLNIPAIGQAVKPRKKAFIKALDILEVNKEKVIVIGDQIFTDIWGGNRMELKTILVNPLVERDFILTKVLRILETLFFARKYQKD